MDESGKLYRGTYRLIKKLGEGGKGVVYLAKHVRLDRDVVLKAERSDCPLSVSSREVDVLKLLKHRYIPTVYDFFAEPDRTVTVMDYIKGESFDKIVSSGETFTQAQVIKWAKQLLEALDYLHSPTHGDPPKGFVHSDIKPANIMRLPNGDICLIDFNISLALGDVRVTGYTPAYASPEHFGFDFSGSGSFTGGKRAGRRVRGFDVGTQTGQKPSAPEPAESTAAETADSALTEDIYSGSLTEGMTAGDSFGTESTGNIAAQQSFDYEVTEYTDELTGAGYVPGEPSVPAAPESFDDETTEYTDVLPGESAPEGTAEVSQPADGTGSAVQSASVSAGAGESSATGATRYDSESVYSTESGSVKASHLWKLSEGSRSEKKIIPDVRSDIYCLGLTLCYLLTGRNPRRSSDRAPKSIEDFVIEPVADDKISAPFADILAKSMEPDPEQRYGSAAEMLEAINMLHYNDPRSRRLRRAKAIVAAVSCTVFAAGLFTAFVGMQRGNTEKTSIGHADESITLMNGGDRAGALREALAGLPAKNMLFAPEYLAKPQLALASATEVYDLRGGFSDTAKVKLPGVPSFVRLSPDGRTGLALCGGRLEIFSAESGSVTKELAADPSYLSEAEFIDSDTIVFAGAEGLTVYEITADKVRFTGTRATSVAVSGDGKKVAGIYLESTEAFLYDAATGEETCVDLFGGYQPCPAPEVAVNGLNAFELSEDGSQLLVGLYYDRPDMGLDGVYVTQFDTLGSSAQLKSTPGGAEQSTAAFAGGAVMTAVCTREHGSELRAGSAADGAENMQVLNDANRLFEVSAHGDKFFVRNGSELDIFSAENVMSGDLAKDRFSAVTAGGSILAFDADGTHVLIADGAEVGIYGMSGTRINYADGSGRTTVRNLCAVRNGTAVYGNGASDELQIARLDTDSSTFVADYSADFPHTESRLSADGKHIMQFSSKAFRILSADGSVAVGETPLPENTADPRYVRNGESSYLEVLCKDGSVIRYDGATGAVVGEDKTDPPDMQTEEFVTDRFRIVSQFRRNPAEVFDKASGKKLGEIEKYGELAYVYSVNGGLLLQFSVKEDYADGEIPTRGVLLDENLEPVAEMDYLCDYNEKTRELLFDYPEGSLRRTKLYTTEELISLARGLL